MLTPITAMGWSARHLQSPVRPVHRPMPTTVTRYPRRFGIAFRRTRRATSRGIAALAYVWILLLVAAAGGAGFYFWSDRPLAPAADAQHAAAAQASAATNLPA